MIRNLGTLILLAFWFAACSSSAVPGLSVVEIPGSPGSPDAGAVSPDASAADPGAGKDPSPVADPGSKDNPPAPDPGTVVPDVPPPSDLPLPLDVQADAIVVVDAPIEVVADLPVVPDVLPPECLLGESRSVPCGVNGRGVQPQVCVDGHWTPQGPCQDLDVCKDGASQTATCAEGKGKVSQTCTLGQWTDAGPCIQPGRWHCQDNVCTPVFGSSTCGDGKCDAWKGESKASCPGDCDFGSEPGEGKSCKNAWDCAAYAWPAGGVGYWQCSGFFNKTCVAVHTGEYCGTEGQDYCYIDSMYIETPESCPADCPSPYLNCGSDVECIVQPWPQG